MLRRAIKLRPFYFVQVSTRTIFNCICLSFGSGLPFEEKRPNFGKITIRSSSRIPFSVEDTSAQSVFISWTLISGAMALWVGMELR